MAQKPFPHKEDGYYVFTLSSYEPVKATLTRPELNWDAAAATANAMITERGGSHQSHIEWFKTEFGVASAQDLFKECLAYQQKEIDLYVELETKKTLTGQLALRVVEELPEELYSNLTERYLADQLTQLSEHNSESPSRELPFVIKESTRELAQQRAYQDVLRSVALEAYAYHFGITVTPQEIQDFAASEDVRDRMIDASNTSAVAQALIHDKAYKHLLERSEVRYI